MNLDSISILGYISYKNSLVKRIKGANRVHIRGFLPRPFIVQGGDGVQIHVVFQGFGLAAFILPKRLETPMVFVSPRHNELLLLKLQASSDTVFVVK